MSLGSRFGLTNIRHLSRVWTEIEQGALSRLTGRVRPGLPDEDLGIIRRQLDECLSESGGAVVARARAARVGRQYLELNSQGRDNFLRLLADEYGVDRQALRESVDLLRRADQTETGQTNGAFLKAQSQLRSALRSPRTRLLTQFNVLPQGLKFLCEMRAQLLSTGFDDDAWLAFDEEFKELLANWFDVGFLKLERITWDAPASLLEALAEHEAVHSIRSWQDIKHRLAAPDRRCFAFTHEQIPDQPLIFVWVALTDGIAGRIDDLLRVDQKGVDVEKADTAIFYSISATQPGLDGVGFGSFLIKRVVDLLVAEHKQLKTFATLSPIPGFRNWLLREIAADESEKNASNQSLRAALAKISDWGSPENLFTDRRWPKDGASVRELQEPLMTACAFYLTQVKRDKGARDRVANFHLSNGAGIERINFGADFSRNGQAQSAGLMVNYRYRQKDIEKNHEAYVRSGEIAQSRAVRSLV